MWVAVVLLAALLLAVLLRVYVGFFGGSSPNPFAQDVKRPLEPLVTDKAARKKVLKQGQLGVTVGSRTALRPSAHAGHGPLSAH